jgi:endoglucanase Acf2
MNSWAGLTLLGAVLDDQDMVSCGAMGYAIESEAIKEYYNDYYHQADLSTPQERGSAAAPLASSEVDPGGGAAPAAAEADPAHESDFPPGYGHHLVGILNDNGNVFGTFFNAEPRFIYEIQWLPLTPSLHYLGWDPAFGKAQWENMLAEQQSFTPGFTLEKLDPFWDHVALGYLMVNDPEGTVQTFERLWQDKSPIATAEADTPSSWATPISYYFMHAWRRLGTLAPDAWADQPTAAVYRHGGDGALTLVAWNP